MTSYQIINDSQRLVDLNKTIDNKNFVETKKKLFWLNTFYRTGGVITGSGTAGAIYKEVWWDIPPLVIKKRANLKIVSFTSNEDAAKPLIIKLNNILYDNNTSYSSDGDTSTPTIFINHIKAIGSVYNQNYNLTIVPQVLNRIHIILNNTFIAKSQGFAINDSTGAGHFILGILIEDYEDTFYNITNY